jgi:copper homeostasis protein
MKIEIACFNIASAFIADSAGADRIELCVNKAVGGLTPKFGDFELVKATVFVPVFVMIRPIAGGFRYNDKQFAQMLADIKKFKQGGADGFVFGILNADNTIDVERNNMLVNAAYPVPCTFHRAFDATPDLNVALEQLVSCGFSTVLTSGGAENVSTGVTMLAKLVKQAGDRITVMPGGGLRAANLSEIISRTNADFYHSAAIIDSWNMPNEGEIKKMKTLME